LGVIRVLPQTVINKIAAGEVVERPASVIKELLENSLDAAATRIEVELEEGGRKLIRVTDNGQGMDAEDLALAFESHATSKLRDSADLSFITTLGFRGEALPSIGAVSQTRLVSRPHGAASGHEISVHGGKLSELKACGAAEGTVIEVRNLFFNMPARRKFLRSIPTETSHIVDMFTQIALARPDIHLVLKRGQHEIINTPPSEDGRDRLADLFTAELAEELLAVDGGQGPARVTGYVAPPHEARANRKLQKIFLNRRLVQDKGLARAVADAYAGLLPPGRFPPVFLFIQMDPREVDVNVSPTKLHVRFRNAQQVFVAVRQAVATALSSHDIQPRVPLPGTEASPLSRPARSTETAPAPPSQAPALPLTWSDKRPSDQRPRPSDSPAGRDSPPPTPSPVRHFAQLHNAFIVAECSDGLEIIDQHALHERLLYEQIEKRLTQAPLESQRLLVPEVVPLSKRELDLLTPAIESAKALGIEIELFGERSVAVHALPSLLAAEDPARLVRDLLDELAEGSDPGRVGELRERLMQMIACKAAVKAGQALTDEEIDSLLRRRQLSRRPETCPHGRPTSLRLPMAKLAKYFKRT